MPNEIHCQLCKSDEYRELRTASALLGLDAPYAVVQCNQCDLIRLHPQPTAAEYVKHYGESEYYSWDEYEQRANVKMPLFHARIEQIEMSCRCAGGRSIVDLGCAAGHFLKVAHDRGWNCQGVEISPPLANYAREKFGLQVFGSVGEAISTGDTVDVVHSNHSLEHVLDPAEVIRDISSLLKPGGIVSIEVPYQLGSWRELTRLALVCLLGKKMAFKLFKPGVDPLHHTHFYTPRTIVRLLEDEGLQIESLSTVNFAYYRTELLTGAKKSIYRILDGIASLAMRGPFIVCLARKPVTPSPLG